MGRITEVSDGRGCSFLAFGECPTPRLVFEDPSEILESEGRVPDCKDDDARSGTIQIANCRHTTAAKAAGPEDLGGLVVDT